MSRAASSAKPVDAAAGDPLLELPGGSLRDDASSVEDRDAVGELVGLLEVLRGEEHRGAVTDQVVDDLPHGAAAARVEAGSRLVEEDDLRPAHERHRQIESPAHPARIRRDEAVGRLDQLEALEQVADSPARVGAYEVMQVGHQREVLASGEQIVDGRELARNSDRVAYGVGLACHVVPRDPDLAVVRLEQGGEDAHHRGLARPVGSEEREDAACSTVKSTPSRTTFSPKDMRTSMAVIAGEEEVAVMVSSVMVSSVMVSQ